MSLGKTLDRWRSARQLRNTRLSRQALQRMDARQASQPPPGEEFERGHRLGWTEGFQAGYKRGWRDRDAGRQDATAREGPPA